MEVGLLIGAAALGVVGVSQGAAVSEWQQQQIRAGACYYRGMIALNEGSSERLEALSSECSPRSGARGS